MKRVEHEKALLYLIAVRVNFCSNIDKRWYQKVLASGRPSVGDELSSGGDP